MVILEVLQTPGGSRRAIGQGLLGARRVDSTHTSGALLLRRGTGEKGVTTVIQSRILIGLDTPEHVGVLTELGIRWTRWCFTKLVGLAIVDEPGIRAIEPLGSIGGTPGINPVYYMGYENRMAEYRQRAGELLATFARRCGESGIVYEQVTGVGARTK